MDSDLQASASHSASPDRDASGAPLGIDTTGLALPDTLGHSTDSPINAYYMNQFQAQQSQLLFTQVHPDVNMNNTRPMTAPSSVSAPYYSSLLNFNSSMQQNASQQQQPFAFTALGGNQLSLDDEQAGAIKDPLTGTPFIYTNSPTGTGPGAALPSSAAPFLIGSGTLALPPNAIHLPTPQLPNSIHMNRNGAPNNAQTLASKYITNQSTLSPFYTVNALNAGAPVPPPPSRGLPPSRPTTASSGVGRQGQKRIRRRYDEIERLYACDYPGCSKAYGTLNHLNSHKVMQKHGPKSTPEQFKELRKAWRENKKAAAAAAQAAAQQMITPPATGNKQSAPLVKSASLVSQHRGSLDSGITYPTATFDPSIGMQKMYPTSALHEKPRPQTSAGEYMIDYGQQHSMLLNSQMPFDDPTASLLSPAKSTASGPSSLLPSSHGMFEASRSSSVYDSPGNRQLNAILGESVWPADTTKSPSLEYQQYLNDPLTHHAREASSNSNNNGPTHSL